jgi:hypothetical protein
MNNSDPTMEKKRISEEEGPDVAIGEVSINASGHKDQLKRQYGVVVRNSGVQTASYL